MDDKNSLPYEDWWMDDQKELVDDTSIVWQKKRFKPVAGFWLTENGKRILSKISEHEILPPNAIIDNKAWDHEHCSLCWKKISEYPVDDHEGYTNEKDWLCIECYNKYIVTISN